MTPETHSGLLGICLSGAGPTILALATENFEKIGQGAVEILSRAGVTASWKLLTLGDGSSVAR